MGRLADEHNVYDGRVFLSFISDEGLKFTLNFDLGLEKRDVLGVRELLELNYAGIPLIQLH